MNRESEYINDNLKYSTDYMGQTKIVFAQLEAKSKDKTQLDEENGHKSNGGKEKLGEANSYKKHVIFIQGFLIDLQHFFLMLKGQDVIDWTLKQK